MKLSDTLKSIHKIMVNSSGLGMLLGMVLILLFSSVASAQVNYQWGYTQGNNQYNFLGVYGTKGVPSENNLPGFREGAVTWKDSDGNLWMFGGYRYNYQESQWDNLNDLWKYDPETGRWTWMSGSKEGNVSGTYGQQGVASADNVPGSRQGAVGWVGPDGHLWLFGGSRGGYMSDLWKYNIETGKWSWEDGPQITSEAGSYGTKGVASSSNNPGAREYAVGWVDDQGNFWLFGGYGYDGDDFRGDMNDLWKYDLSTGQWTWMKGSSTHGAVGNYGTKGISGSSNTPGERQSASTWTGPEGNLWLFGGWFYDNGYFGRNDLWRYNPSTNQWTWMKGSSQVDQLGDYGTKGVEAATNEPLARHGSSSWVSPDGKLWLFGGESEIDSNSGYLNDGWQYDPSTNNWTWMAGTDQTSSSGLQSGNGTPSANNMVSGRARAASWVDDNGYLRIFGGDGYSAYSNLWMLASEPASLSMDGIDDYAYTPDAGELDLTDQFTIEMWVKIDDVNRSGPGKNYMTLAMKGSFSDAYGLFLNTGSSSKTLTFYHNGASASSTSYDWTSIQSNTWYHVAATYNSNTAKIYIDGNEVASQSVSGSVNSNTEPLYLGRDGGSTPYPFDGTMAEVHVWDKMLNQSDINDLMNNSVSGLEPGFAGGWLSRNGGMHSAVDLSGAGNNMIRYQGSYTTDFPPLKAVVAGIEGWHFIGAPGSETTYSNFLEEIWTQGYSGSDGGTAPSSNVYFYDEISRSWQSPSSTTNITGTANDNGDGAGKGILVYVYADDNNDGQDDAFPKTLTMEDFGGATSMKLPLSYTDTGVWQNDGWHLVSNPFPVAINWADIVRNGANNNMLDYAYIWDQTMNNGAGGYQIHYGEPKPPSMPGSETFDGRIPAFQSFWVKAEGPGAQLDLQADQQVVNTSMYKSVKEDIPYLMLELKGNKFKDAVSVVFPSNSEQARADVPKMNSLASNHAELFLLGNQKQRWMARHIIPGKQQSRFTIPLDVDITINGTYELSWNVKTIPANWSVEIEEVATGRRIDLASAKDYQFSMQGQKKKLGDHQQALPLPVPPGSAHAKQADHTPRFRLHIQTKPVSSSPSDIPTNVKLTQNYPNPFNPTTQIEYQVPKKAAVNLEVYDMLGKKVATLVNEQKAAGSYQVQFNAAGLNLSSGLYIYRLRVGNKTMSRKMTLLK